jgi:2,4-dienoyl-CoA reductase-like NADH-dependent reductase (Old Yellow Enzyme family)
MALPTDKAPHLLSPVTLGELELRNRVVMAPLTRGRADEDRTPNDLMVGTTSCVPCLLC